MEEIIPTRQSSVQEKLSFLDKEIRGLFEEVDNLEEKLQPVLSSKPISPQETAEAEPTPKRISSYLQNSIDSLITLQNRIREIRKRLEI